MNKNGTRKTGLKKAIAIAVLLLLCALVVFAVVFVNDYYHAAAAAADAINAPAPGVSITREGSTLIVSPENPENIRAGLIFYPGGKVEYTAYAPLLSELAGNGIYCVLVKMPCNLATLDYKAAGKIIAAHSGISDWFIGGHSMGGVAAAMYLEEHVSDFRGLFLLGSYSIKDLTGSGLAVISVYGENDGVMNRGNYGKYISMLPEGFEELVIPGGNHAYFGSYGEQKGDGTATISPAEQQAITAGAILSWISDTIE